MNELEPPCILIVDDERQNRKILAELLEKDYQVLVAKNGTQALERLNKNPDVHLVLLDVVMPDVDGYEVIRQIKANEAFRDIPVIFITALNSSGDEQAGLNLGAADYISKPFNPAIVRLRVENQIRLARQNMLLKVLANHDGLTQVFNRRMFDEVMVKEWLRAKRIRSPLSLAMIDVDFFKLFNDNYGHSRGDDVLKGVARTLASGLKRAGDMVARYGGEEFVLLLPDTEAQGAEKLAEKVRLAVEDLKIPHEYSQVARWVTVSIGGATAMNFQGPHLNLLEAADAMLYQAKTGGRNRVIWTEL